MPVLITGINHKTADLNLREQVAFVVDELPAALQDAHHSIEGLAGVVILSTCNRTEIIGSGENLEDHSLIHWLAENRKMSAAALLGHLYSYQGTEAMEHLARVACGMDSMVFGEPQILGQVKESFDIARQHEYINPELGRLFPHVFHIAKQVRTETGIGTSSVSLASAILVLARQLFGNLDELEALLIGAGEMMELASHRLQDQGLRRVVFANRTRARAKKLASGGVGNCPVTLEEIPRFLSQADIVVSGTASPQTIIDRNMMQEALRRRPHTVLMVDLAVPRDIDPALGELENIHLYGIDDLQDLVEDAARRRSAEAERAALLISEQTANYRQKMRGRDADQLIASYRERAHKLCREEEKRAQKRLREGADAEAVLHDMAQSLTGKLVHAPSVGLRRAGEEGRQDVLDWAPELLGVPAEENKQKS